MSCHTDIHQKKICTRKELWKILHLSLKIAGKVVDKFRASIPPAYDSKFSRVPFRRGEEESPVSSRIPLRSLVLLQE
jgi:hypothetical protein